jgi:peptidoglycan/LPS O-acetylase OafA/YrhL
LWLTNLKRFILMQSPQLPTAFAGTPFPALNGSMWSIGYEFRCYLAVLIVGMAGGFRRRGLILAITCTLVGASIAIGDQPSVWPRFFDGIIGETGLDLSMFGIFFCGVSFFLFREMIAYTPLRCAIAAVALVAGLRTPHLATFALETAGCYLLFAFIFGLKSVRLAAFGTKVDLSYGVYLYAFPIQKLSTYWRPDLTPAVLTVIACVASAAFAYLSWTFVEKPAVAWRSQELEAIEITAASPTM